MKNMVQTKTDKEIVESVKILKSEVDAMYKNHIMGMSTIDVLMKLKAVLDEPDLDFGL